MSGENNNFETYSKAIYKRREDNQILMIQS